MLALILAATVASAALGSAPDKPKPERKPVYTGAITLTGHLQVLEQCEYGWTTDWEFDGTYSATQIDSTATLDAATRTASGAAQWSLDSCGYDYQDSGACAVGVEPAEAGYAGFEDAVFRKAPGGFEVKVEVDKSLTALERGCHASFMVDSQGFIPSSKLGDKTIRVPLAGTVHVLETGRSQDGQENGTLTLTRKGKR